MNIRPTPSEDLLGLEGLVTTRVDRDSFPDETFVFARSTLAKGDCPYCGADRMNVVGQRREEGSFKDVALHGRMATSSRIGHVNAALPVGVHGPTGSQDSGSGAA